MKTRIRPWMLAYTIIFGLWSIKFVYNNFLNQYPLVFSAWDGIYYIVIFVGNLLYSINRFPFPIRTLWKGVFPMIVLQFVFAGIYDSQHGKHAKNAETTLLVVVWIFGLVLFSPSFWAHYRIGYGKLDDKNMG